MAINRKNLSELQELLQSKKAAWRAGETSILELNEKERRLRLGYRPGPNEPSIKERETIALHNLQTLRRSLFTPLVSAFDWRNVSGRNFISSIKDQGSCGSCVAFGVAATVEATARVTVNLAVNDGGGGALPDLSEAQLYYCGGGAGVTCETGWYPQAALNYCANPGLAPDSCFPYSPGDQPCNLCPGWQSLVTTATNSHYINSIAAMKQWISTRGPLVACFSVYADFYSYSSGVYTHQSGGLEGGHCVSCIGYNDGLQAWLCKNSWGTGWGESGFFWIGYGQCGIDAGMNAVDSFGTVYPLYNDLFLRDNLSDSGSVPAQGTPSASPDIIPSGTSPIADPAAYFTANYGSDVGQDLIANIQNYIYMRAKNLDTAGAETGSVSLYYSPASLLLYPSLWQNNILKTSDGATSVPISASAAGTIAVATDPFTWIPQMISDDHYCLVGRIVTAKNPNPIPATGGIQDFASYIANNRGMGWRNVRVIDNGSPTFSTSVQYNQGTTAGVMAVLITCTGVPAGAEVSFTCGTPGPVPPINLPKTKVTDATSFVVGISTNIPANFESSIVYSYWANGLSPLPGWGVGLSVIYFVPNSNVLYRHGKTLKELRLNEKEHHPLLKQHFGIEPVKGIIVGGHITKGTDL